jgi:hypothetical protein
MKWYQHIFGRDQTDGYARGSATKGAGHDGEKTPAKKAEMNQTATAKEILQRQNEYSNQELINMRLRNSEISKLKEAYEASTTKGKIKKFLASDSGKIATSVAVQFAASQLAAKTKNPTVEALSNIIAQSAQAKAGKGTPDISSLIKGMRKPEPMTREEEAQARLDAELAALRHQRDNAKNIQQKYVLAQEIDDIVADIGRRKQQRGS